MGHVLYAGSYGDWELKIVLKFLLNHSIFYGKVSDNLRDANKTIFFPEMKMKSSFWMEKIMRLHQRRAPMYVMGLYWINLSFLVKNSSSFHHFWNNWGKDWTLNNNINGVSAIIERALENGNSAGSVTGQQNNALALSPIKNVSPPTPALGEISVIDIDEEEINRTPIIQDIFTTMNEYHKIQMGKFKELEDRYKELERKLKSTRRLLQRQNFVNPGEYKLMAA